MKEKLLKDLESLLQDCKNGYDLSDEWGPYEWSAITETIGLAIEYIEEH